MVRALFQEDVGLERGSKAAAVTDSEPMMMGILLTHLVDEDDRFPHGGDVKDALQCGVEIRSMGPEISGADDVQGSLHMFARSLSGESLA